MNTPYEQECEHEHEHELEHEHEHEHEHEQKGHTSTFYFQGSICRKQTLTDQDQFSF